MELSLVPDCVETEEEAISKAALQLSGRGYDSLNNNLGRLVMLRRLDLAHNELQDITALGQLTALTWLNLAHNRVESLAALEPLHNLITLNAGYNRITSMDVIIHFPALKALVLNNNNIQHISGLDNAAELDALVLSHNQLATVEEDALRHCVKLRKLGLAHNQLEALPHLHCTHLKECRINHNAMQKVPYSLAACPHLCLLDVAHNKVKELKYVNVLSKLKFLQNLNLKNNPVAELLKYREQVTRLCKGLRILDNQRLDAPAKNTDMDSDDDDLAKPKKGRRALAPGKVKGKPASRKAHKDSGGKGSNKVNGERSAGKREHAKASTQSASEPKALSKPRTSSRQATRDTGAKQVRPSSDEAPPAKRGKSAPSRIDAAAKPSSRTEKGKPNRSAANKATTTSTHRDASTSANATKPSKPSDAQSRGRVPRSHTAEPVPVISGALAVTEHKSSKKKATPGAVADELKKAAAQADDWSVGGW